MTETNRKKIRMKKIKGMIIALAVGAAAFATSCQKDETLRYYNATMGNIVDGRFVSDQGNTFNIVEQTCEGRLDTLKRAFTICDILSSTGTNEYDVRLNYITSVLTKAPSFLRKSRTCLRWRTTRFSFLTFGYQAVT